MTYFELVNLSSGNLVGEFDTEDAALDDVRDVVRRTGAWAFSGIALTRDDDGHGKVIAEGADLVQHALEAAYYVTVPAAGAALV